VHQKITQFGGIEYVRVVEDNECGHNQIPISWSYAASSARAARRSVSA
jgi:hypothetical protein